MKSRGLNTKNKEYPQKQAVILNLRQDLLHVWVAPEKVPALAQNKQHVALQEIEVASSFIAESWAKMR